MNITLRQLRAFVAVAEHQQFTRAAKDIHVTQAALSMLVRDLENEIGLRLFDRHTRMVRLTDAGKGLLGMARRVLSDVEIAIEQSHEYSTYQRGRVTIASGTVLSSILLTPFMRHFQSRYPGIKLHLRDMAEQDIQQHILHDNIDMGIGTCLDAHHDIAEISLFSDFYVAVMPKEHSLSQRRRVSWKMLCDHPFIALSPNNPIRQEIDRHLVQLGLTLSEVHEVSFHTTVLSMVRHGLGLSVLPANSQNVPEASGLVFKSLGAPRLQRKTGVFQLRNRSLSPAARLFRDELLQYAKARQ